MNQKILKIFRFLLYGVALYIVLDLFVFSSTEKDSTQLSLYNKKNTVTYFEYFIRFNDVDSTWSALQTMPALGQTISLDKINPWKESDSFESLFEKRNLVLVGFYVTSDMLLDRSSFIQIAKRIDDLKAHQDQRLNTLNKYKSFTAVFVRK